MVGRILVPLGLCGAVMSLTPAMAQTTVTLSEGGLPACVGQAAGLAWIGEGREGSALGADHDEFEQVVSVGMSERRALAFRIDGDRRGVRIEAIGQGSGDPNLMVLDATGRNLGQNDDFGQGLDSRLDLDLGAGEYCAVVNDVGGGSLDVALRVSDAQLPARVMSGGASDIGACTEQTVATVLDKAAVNAALAGGAAVRTTFEGAGPNYVRFTLPDGAAVQLTATSVALDPRISLFSASGDLLADNDDADGLNSRLDLIDSLPGGTYCLGVGSLRSGAGQIDVALGGIDRAAVLRTAYRNGSVPPGADSGYPVEALDITSSAPQVRLMAGGALWFSFDLAERQVVVLSASGSASGLDSKLGLFDTRGRLVAENDDHDGVDPQIGPIVLDPGSYRLALSEVGGGGVASVMRPVTLVAERFVSPR